MHYIGSFSGPYRFLSNFYIEPDGTHVEGEYQASKALNPIDADFLRRTNHAKAKKVGQKIPMRPGWEEHKLDIMFRLVQKKFDDHRSLAEMLLDTGDAILEEGNWWNDTFWGVCNGVGHNHLGKILMRVREDTIPF